MAALDYSKKLTRLKLRAELAIFREYYAAGKTYGGAAFLLDCSENYFGRRFRELLLWEEGERAVAEAIARGEPVPPAPPFHVERPTASKEPSP